VGEMDRAVAVLAAEQHGAISVGQLRALGADRGLPSRRLKAGVWFRESHGVYVIAGSPATFEQRVMVALLAAGPGSVVSHRTAGVLWGLVRSATGPIEISVPRNRHHVQEGVVVHRSRDLHLARPVRREGIAVTGAARTLLDIGAVAPESVRRAVWRGLRSSVIAWPILLRTLVEHGRHGRGGVGALRRVVAEHYDQRATDSDTEDVAFEILVDSGRVPLPEKQVAVTCADGVEVTIDLGWPRYGALLEVFGVDHLTNEDLQHLDLHRRNQIELAGHRLLIYTGRLLERQPDQFVRDVEALLQAGGWSGPETGHVEPPEE
jgi:hypothetical protein